LLFAVGLKDIITNEKNLKNTLMVLAGILIVGAGIALAFGGWIPLAIAAAVAALAGIAIWGDEIAAWLDNLKGLFDNWVVTVKEKITGFFDNLIDKVKNVSPELAGILEYIKNIFISVIDWFKAKIDWLINTCRNFVKIIRDLFRGDFKAVWEDLKQYFKDWWQGLVNIFIAPLNFLISCFESFVNFFIRGINKIIGGLNSLSFDMPDWLGGGHFGLNLKLVDEANFGRINELGTSSSSGKGLLSSSYSGAAGGFSNSKTVVDNNEQIVEGISRGVSDANAEQNTLLREQNKLLTQMLHSSGGGTVPVSTITKGLERQNRRNGKVIVPVGN